MNYRLSICTLFLGVMFFGLVAAKSTLMCYSCFDNSTCAQNPLNTSAVAVQNCDSMPSDMAVACLTISVKIDKEAGRWTYRNCSSKTLYNQPICDMINVTSVGAYTPGLKVTDVSCSTCETNYCNTGSSRKDTSIVAIILSCVLIMKLTR